MSPQITGRIHSFQSMGAVDGPGLRFVVFMQGCPLRCCYCHNPDTWDVDGGTEYTPEEVLERILRYKAYIQKGGGVTVSGGEPLLQWEFVEKLFTLLQAEGIHTALDTSGICPSADIACTSLSSASLSNAHVSALQRVLAYTDLVLCDLKFGDSSAYLEHTGADMDQVSAFLMVTQEMGIPLWIRHVVVPGLTDHIDQVLRIASAARSFSNFEKLELLPFRKLCTTKYDELGIPFPLAETPEMSDAGIAELYRAIESHR